MFAKQLFKFQNILTLLGIPIAFLALFFVIIKNKILIISTILALAILDILDGIYVKVFSKPTKFGAQLDVFVHYIQSIIVVIGVLIAFPNFFLPKISILIALLGINTFNHLFSLIKYKVLPDWPKNLGRLSIAIIVFFLLHAFIYSPSNLFFWIAIAFLFFTEMVKFLITSSFKKFKVF